LGTKDRQRCALLSPDLTLLKTFTVGGGNTVTKEEDDEKQKVERRFWILAGLVNR